jgi:aldehyde dehydrogenase (NAD+)
MAPAIAMGNRVVLVASEPYPLIATEFYQVLETSDLPGGVVNILTGSHEELAGPMATHMDLDAVWSFSGHAKGASIEEGAAGVLKRTWVEQTARDWMGSDGEGKPFLEAATEIKTVWVPYGA